MNSLTVAIPEIQAPVVLADSRFLETLAQVEAQVAALAINDDAGAQAAADIQIRLTTAGKKLDATRKGLKAPFIEAGRLIDAAAREPMERIEAAKDKLKQRLTAYVIEQDRRAREAEAARQKELARLEAIRLAEEKEAKRLADEAMRLQREQEAAALEAAEEGDVLLLEDSLEPEAPREKTETEKAIEAVRYAPAPVAAKPIGVSFRVTLVPTVTDLAALPDQFVIRTPNTQGLIATFCTPWKEGSAVPTCPGVSFEIKREPVSTGRRMF